MKHQRKFQDASEKWGKVAAADFGGLIAYSVKSLVAGPWAIGAAATATVATSATMAIMEFRTEIWDGITSAFDWVVDLF